MTTTTANAQASTPAPRRIGRLVLVAILVWIASIFVAEVAFRFAGTRVVAAMGGFYETFGDNGYKHKPLSAAYHDWASGTFWAYTDRLGLRVGEPERQRAADRIDILVLGDSQAFGQGVEFEQSVIGVLAAEAAKQGLVVGNGAVGGHSVRDQLAVGEWLVRERGVRPRLVLYCLSPRAIAYPDAISEAIVIDGGLWESPPTWKDHLRRWLVSHSAVFVVSRDAARNIRDRLRPSKGPSAASDILTLYEKGAVQTLRAEQLASMFRKFAGEIGVEPPRLVFAYLPLAIEPRIDSMAADAKFSASGRAALETATKLAEMLTSPLVDLSPAVEQVRTNGGAVTLDGDNHYGPVASRLVGERLWDWIAERVPTSPQAGGK